MTILASTTRHPNRRPCTLSRISRGEMLRQSHWKTQIEGLTKRQFVQVSVHRARVCTRSKMRSPPPAPKAKDPSYRTPSPSNHLPFGVELPSSSRDRTSAPGSRRGEYDVSSPTADPRTTIPGGALVARRGRSTPSIAATGGDRRRDDDDDDGRTRRRRRRSGR